MTFGILARMNLRLALACTFLLAVEAHAQIQVDLKFKRVQHVAYEPIIATVNLTNLAGRDIELRNENGQQWFGFEVSADEGRYLPATQQPGEPPLRIAAGETVARKVNLARIYPVQDSGPYHVRANVYFADLNKFFYSASKVVQVTDARPIWQRTVGIPDGSPDAGDLRTYSLLTHRFPDHAKLYVRVENKNTGAVYSTFSLGRLIAFDEPQAELDRSNQLHVLHCTAPRTWSYARVGLNGQILSRSTFMETKSRPRLRHAANGSVAVQGGMLDAQVQSSQNPVPKLSDRPPSLPSDD
jgi:hypothetical protein